jgi:hypothetical protein
MNIFLRRMAIALAVATSAGAMTAQAAPCDEFRVLVEQRGSSGFVIRLVDVQDHGYIPPKPVTLTVTASDGLIRPVSGDREQPFNASYRGTFPVSTPFPAFEFKTTGEWWPEDVNIAATVEVPQLPPAYSKPLVVAVPPPVATALALALVGALLWSFLQIAHASRRDRKTILVALALGVAAGIVAYFAASTPFIWQAVGFEASPLKPQSYFLLGLAISVIGVRRLLQKITGMQDETPAVTPESLRSEIITLLDGDRLRRPFLDEVRKVIFDDLYVTRNAHLIPRLEFALAAAKAGATIPDGLTDHVSAGLEPLYAGSYRRDYHARFDGTIDLGSRTIDWTHTIYYEFVRNTADTATEPEIKFSHVANVPELLQKQSTRGELESLGTIVKSLRFSIRDAAGGSPISYKGTEGRTLIRTEAPPGVTCAESIDVTLTHHAADKEVSAKFEWPFPPDHRQTKAVRVEIETKTVGELKDGVTYFRVSRLTQGFHVYLKITPPLQLDIVEFDWKHAKTAEPDIDQKAGTAHLTGWLLPGNGVCISWSGTKDLAGDVKGERERKSSSLARRMLDSLPWKK